MAEKENKIFKFMEKHLMVPMGKIANLRIVRSVVAAGVATLPFTIVGSMFLVLNVLPQAFPVLQPFWDMTFNRFSSLYMLINTSTMSILSLYFCLAFGYEYTKIHQQEEKVDLTPLSGALLSLFAFFLCVPELVFKDGMMTLLEVNTKTETVIHGYRMGWDIMTRLGTGGIFTAIIMSIIAVKIYYFLVKKHWTIKMPAGVPQGVSRAFTALVPAFFVGVIVILINGILITIDTDIFKVVEIPFSFVTSLTNSWLGMIAILAVIQSLWIVGIHGANIVTALISPIVLANMALNVKGDHIPFAGEFLNAFVTMGGSGATLGLVIMMSFFAKSAQMKTLGRTALIPSIFNINEPIVFGLPIVYNPYMAIPFFLAPMVAGTLAYFAIKFQLVAPVIAQAPWPTPIGINAFLSTGGDYKAAILSVICAVLSALVYLPFFKMYDKKLVHDEQLATK